jgi:hypothetical protein
VNSTISALKDIWPDFKIVHGEHTFLRNTFRTFSCWH